MDPEYHPLVIGKGGSVITKIRTDYGVQINLPKRGEPDANIITIQGYEDKALQAKEAIMAIVHQLVSLYCSKLIRDRCTLLFCEYTFDLHGFTRVHKIFSNKGQKKV